MLVVAGLLMAAACSSSGSSKSTSTTTTATGGSSTGGASATTTTAAAGSGSSTGGSSSSGAAKKPCQLFPIATAEQMTGLKLQSGSDTASDCTYDRGDSADHLAVVTVAMATGADQPHQYDFDKGYVIGGDTPIDVPGVGDHAYYTAGMKMLVTVKGNNLFHISVIESSIADPKTLVINIGKLVCSKV